MGLSARAAQYGETISSETNTLDATTAEGLNVPTDARSALITAGAQAVRWRTDGTDPTATVGHFLASNANLEVFNRDLKKIKLIATSATSDIIITYFKE